MEIRYEIQYEGLYEELVNDSRSSWVFDRVKDYANKYRVELSDEEFSALFRLQNSDRDVDWIVHKMGVYKTSFIDALISYITY